MNTFICSFFEKLKARSTKFHHKLENSSPFVESKESYFSEPKYDINTTQNIYIGKSKKLFATIGDKTEVAMLE
jgi:hypothetical protein